MGAAASLIWKLTVGFLVSLVTRWITVVAGYFAGKRAARSDSLERETGRAKRRNEIDAEVRRLDDAALDERLRRTSGRS